MMGPFRMGVFWRRAFAALVLGRKARVDCFRTVADLLESGFELERALDVTVRAQRGQGPSLRAGLLEGWRRALIENRFAEAMAASAPPAEAMIFQAYGRIEAAVLFAAAARVADLRDRQISAVRKALTMPLTLAAGLAVMLWAAGGVFRAGARKRRAARTLGTGRRPVPRRLGLAPCRTACILRHLRLHRGRNRHGDGPLDRSRPDCARPDRPVLSLPHDHRLGLPVREMSRSMLKS